LPRPASIAVHVVPLSVERKTPLPPVPAYNVEGVAGSMARTWITWLVRPVVIAVHVVPLSVERKTTPPKPP
jgi:hypothetical protein